MPERIIRPSILTSDRINSVSWAAEVFYRRLMSVVDDYGRFDGRASILRAALYPLKLNKVSDSDVGKWMRECAEADLVRVYAVEDKPYVQIERFKQRLRAHVSKYPEPTESADICLHPPAAAVKCIGDGDGDGDGDDSSPPPAAAVGAFDKFWEAYPRKTGKRAAELKWDQLKPDLEKCLHALSLQRQTEQWRRDGGQFIPHPATWLHQGRWDDIPKVDLVRKPRIDDRQARPDPNAPPPISLEEQMTLADELAKSRREAGLR